MTLRGLMRRWIGIYACSIIVGVVAVAFGYTFNEAVVFFSALTLSTLAIALGQEWSATRIRRRRL